MIDQQTHQNRLVNEIGYVLTDRISLESLVGISNCGKNYGIAGGMAIPLHCYSQMPSFNGFRNTDDADISMCPQLTYSQFKDGIAGLVCTHLFDKGYICDLSKPHGNYEIMVREDGSQPFFLHFSRRSQKWLERFGERIKRELENVKEVKIPEREQSVLVIRPEDIVLPKLQRNWEKDLFDLSLLKRYGPKLNPEYLRESAAWWFGGEEKLIDGALNDLRKMSLL